VDQILNGTSAQLGYTVPFTLAWFSCLIWHSARKRSQALMGCPRYHELVQYTLQLFVEYQFCRTAQNNTHFHDQWMDG